MKKSLNAVCAIFLIMLISTSCKNKPIRLFAGTYTETGQKGLYFFDLNPEAGTFRLLSEADAGPNPSYFCISKEKKLIYAADEAMIFNGIKGGGVTALNILMKQWLLKKLRTFLSRLEDLVLYLSLLKEISYYLQVIQALPLPW